LGSGASTLSVPTITEVHAMADLKNDASTDIEAKVKAFAKDMTSWAEKWLKEQKDGNSETGGKGAEKKKKKGKAVESISFSLSGNKVSESRTPAEQAQEVVKGKSYVCWSSHMADSARHVLMKVNGKASWDPGDAFGDDVDQFEKKWGELMKSHGLKNAKGGDGWSSWDGFHLELPDSKMSKSDKRAEACLAEYARLTREDGKGTNDKFEKKYKDLLKPYIEKYEKSKKK
jgi:hypothetical protein